MNPLITPELLAKVEDELMDVYADVDGIPTPADVITTALSQVVISMHEEARAIADCNKVDTCTAEAIVYRHLADWLAELASEVTRQGLPVGEVEGA